MNARLIKQRLRVAEKMKRQPEGKFVAIDLSERPRPHWMTRAYGNNRYIVMIMDNATTDKGPAIRAMIQTVDDRPIINHWSEIQRIKNEIFGEGVTAVEYYPKQTDLVDEHNIYWIWIFPDGILPLPINQ